jgi:uncharacterized protein YqjF (DUF2071 family)
MTYISVEQGELLQQSDLENLFTARVRLHSFARGKLAYTNLEHPPWLVKSARLIKTEQTLTGAAGLAQPKGSPLVHFSPGVRVRVAIAKAL